MYYFNPILTIAALAPAIYILRYVYRHDKLEREPMSLIIALVASGIVATVLAGFLENILFGVLDALFNYNTLIYQLISNYLFVGLVEEGCKYVLLKRKTWKNKEFNCSFDAVVYSVSVSLGFALWENLSYVYSYGLSTALIRAVTAVPGHACFSVFMGAYYGLAKKAESRGDMAGMNQYLKMALIVPTFIHGSYDFVCSIENIFGSAVFVIFIIAMFVVSLKLLKAAAAGDDYIA